ncbi:amidohydrolase [Actinocrispum wychmicini]|uniref:amidohydrolase n=1 Tax=Actinocrispum wychmicini TaxID=1213861 RepID=UPI0010509BBF|nr:amidohydrolase [Actinocrispum wychmicini]
MTADLVLRGGRVVTVDEHFTIAEAVAVAGKEIIAVGTDDSVSELIGPATQVIDLDGRAVLPGINDAHLHLAMFGQSRRNADLTTTDSVAALQALLRAEALLRPDGDWLVGEGWREANIADFGADGPHRSVLDEVTDGRPTVLHHASRHSVLVNTAALRVAGVDRRTPDPVGGIIVRDAAGEPTGVLLESAGVLVTQHAPAPTTADRLDVIVDGMRVLNSLGITSVTDPIVSPELLRDYAVLHQQGRLTVRVNTLLHWDWPSPSTSAERLTTMLRNTGVATGIGDDWLRIGGVKLFADGVPSHGTAWLHRPYLNGGFGQLVTQGGDDDARHRELMDLIETVHRHRLQAQIHVTGDRAADAAIDGIIRAQQADPWPQARHALIHGTLLADDTLPRLAEHQIGVITSSLMRAQSGATISAAIGVDRWSRAFPAGALLAAGVPVADSSDAPVCFPDWRRGLATFVGAGAHPLAEVPPDLRLTREQAIRLWTSDAAYFEHAEHRKGSITAGRLADLVVLDRDPMTAPELADLTPELTIVGGQVVG